MIETSIPNCKKIVPIKAHSIEVANPSKSLLETMINDKESIFFNDQAVQFKFLSN